MKNDAHEAGERDSAILLDNKVKVLSLFVIDALYLSVKKTETDRERGKQRVRERECESKRRRQAKGVFDEITKNCLFCFKEFRLST